MKFLQAALLIVVLTVALFSSYPASAQSPSPSPVAPTGFDRICQKNVEGAIAICIKKIYLFSLGFGALVALLMLVVSGYRYMTAAGNAEQVQNAKDQFETSVKGLVIIFIAFILLYLINPDLVQFTKLKLPDIRI